MRIIPPDYQDKKPVDKGIKIILVIREKIRLFGK